ncbi:MAG: acyl-ACP desaturase [Byssovorax sp.]
MAEQFNIERFMDGSGKVDLSDIDWSEVPKHPMTPEALRTLRYFQRTESSTFFYTKVLMTTKAAIEEPELAPFITVWMYEEEFHGRAFRQFLQAYGEPTSTTFREELFASRGVGERIDEIGQSVLAVVFPEAWPAVHMIWGVVQEFTTYSAYQALIERVNHPILNIICQRIMKQELRHFAFYREQAKKRLARSRMAREVTSRALKIGWTPVGDGMCPREDVLHAIRFLFDGMEGPVSGRIDAKMRELPGLEWFDLFTRFVEEHRIPKAPASWFPVQRTELSKKIGEMSEAS